MRRRLLFTLAALFAAAGASSPAAAQVACDALSAAFETFGPDGPPPGTPQDDALATEAPKLSRKMGRIRLDQSARLVVGWVNGLCPWPGVQLVYAPADDRPSVPVRLIWAKGADHLGGPQIPPGTILDDGSIACAEGAIRVLEIQPAGKRAMTWQDFVNGRRVRPGDHFESVEADDQH